MAVGAGIMIPKSGKANTIAVWPWPYTPLDQEQARIRAHTDYWGGNGCSYAAFNSVISLLREAIGDPYTNLPSELLTYGHGGGAGWGGNCGAINGGAAVISLVCDKATADILNNELFGWYTQTLFPSTISNDYAMNHIFTVNNYDGDLAQNEPESPLCHASVTRWCAFTDTAVGAVERKERCARLTADVAAKVVELLNENYAGTFEPGYVPPASIAGCMACHGSDGLENNVKAKMECVSCHGEEPHTSGIFEGHKNTILLNQNFPNPFNYGTTIEFSLTNRENVTVLIYNMSGEHIKTLISNKALSAGKQSIKWDGNTEYGNNAAPGMYIYRFKAGDAMKSMSMMKMK